MRGAFVGFMVACAGGISPGALAQSVPALDWSGFYVGGQLGLTHGRSGVKTEEGGPGSYLNATDIRQLDRAGDNDLSQWRPSAGLLGGYGRQFGKVLVGIEASATALHVDDDETVSEIYESLPGTRFRLRQSVSADWMGAVRMRLGWAEDKWLGYVTGGFALTRLKFDTLFTDDAFSARAQRSDSKTVNGWSIGLGTEYAMSKNWSLRGEYLYTRFDKVSSSFGLTSTNGSDTLRHSADLDTHSLMLGLSYRFKDF